MARRPLPPPITALLVVLAMLGVGSLGVGVAVALRTAGAGTSLPAPTASGDPSTGVDAPRDDPPSVAPAGSASAAPGRGGTTTTSVAREVLREWDRRREGAWVDGDAHALAALYVPGAVAGRRDVDLLRRWTGRGARVTRLESQVLQLRVLRDDARRLVVQVTDRLVVEARVDGQALGLPRDRPTTRRIELRRGPHITSAWRVVSVRAAPSPAGLSR